LFEAEDFTSLWIDPGHDVPNGAIFAGSVHALEDEQERMAVGCIVKLLQCAEILHVFFKQFVIVLLRCGQCRSSRRPLAQVEFLVWRHMVGLRIDHHFIHLPL
jgi:hypothetical protein